MVVHTTLLLIFYVKLGSDIGLAEVIIFFIVVLALHFYFNMNAV